MEDSSNPYQAPHESPITNQPAARDAPSRLLLAVEGYSNGIIVRRWAATLVDIFVMGLVLGLFLKCCEFLFGNALYQMLAPIIIIPLIFFYYAALESLEGGTAGKFALGIRVVDYQGNRPGALQSLIRTATRFVEVNPCLFGGLPAGIVAVLSRRKQRIGDMLARTLVVYEEDL
jgi:uncharacterized RDD family membrane protein YckC